MKRRAALDVLDLFEDETRKLSELCRLWKTTKAPSRFGEEVVSVQFEHGTVGKLLLRHGAIYLAAIENIRATILATGPAAFAQQLAERADTIRPLLDQIEELSREVNSIWVLTPPFVAAVEQLCSSLQESGSLDENAAGAGAEDVRSALGPRRSGLRSAKYIVKHAPTHPGRPHRYKRLGPLERIHTLYYRVRDLPSENSNSWSDAELAHEFRPRTERKGA